MRLSTIQSIEQRKTLIKKGHGMSDIETDSGINPGHYFELLDRAHIASSYVQMALGEHPVLARHPELMAIYQASIDQLEALYVAIGQHDVTWK